MRYSVAVQEFVETSILAFECGHSEEGLRRELPAPGSKESPFSGVGPFSLPQASRDRGGGVSRSESTRGTRAANLSSEPPCRCSQDEDQAIFYAMVAISWLTLGMAPKATVMRWATAAPVSDESARQWQVRLLVAQ